MEMAGDTARWLHWRGTSSCSPHSTSLTWLLLLAMKFSRSHKQDQAPATLEANAPQEAVEVREWVFLKAEGSVILFT